MRGTGLDFSLARMYWMMRVTRPMSLSAKAPVNSKMLYSLEMPMCCSISASLTSPPSGKRNEELSPAHPPLS